MKTKIRNHRRRAFTLLELTLVIALIGVLMSLVVINVVGTSTKAKKKAAVTKLETIKQQVEAYMLDQNTNPPPDLNTLATLKLVDAKKLKDPWDTPLIYDPRKIDNDHPFTLSSAGPDRITGNEDDISVWEEPKN